MFNKMIWEQVGAADGDHLPTILALAERAAIAAIDAKGTEEAPTLAPVENAHSIVEVKRVKCIHYFSYLSASMP
jgi:hypothetical protein